MLGRLLQNFLGEAEDEEETGSSQDGGYIKDVKQVLFQEDEDSDYGSHKKFGKVSPQRVRGGNVLLPDVFQTSNLLFYERFEAYKDYVLGDCKPSEVGEFIAEYLEQALLPSGWKAVWHTDIFQVLVEVTELSCSSLKAVVQPCEPFLCECFVECVNEQSIRDLLEVKEQKVPLQELHLVVEDSVEHNQTAMAIEHVRFFYQNIWRSWDEEEEDYFDYFTRFAEPRLRLYYDILEDRIPSELVVEYHNILSRCEKVYSQFSSLRNTLSNRDSDSDCELDNVSMVEGMKMDDELENLKRKLKLIENPLLRYLFCYQKSTESCSLKKKGPRPTGECIIHVVSTSMSIETLTCLTRDRLMPQSCTQSQEIQFHKDILEAVNACYDGDLVLVCPGQYSVYGQICIADSIHIEGYGMPDDIIIEKNGKGDKFVECAGACVKISNVKLIQHNAVEGIVRVLGGKTELENCVLQCDTTGVTVKKSAELVMMYCDLYGAKGAGVEIYPGSNCSLIDNGIHHCRDGILIKDFIDEVHDLPKITLENNVIHNNEGYAVVLVKPGAVMDGPRPETRQEATNMDANVVEDNGSADVIQQESEEVVHPEDEDNCPPASSNLVPEGDADLLPDEDNCPPASSELVPEGDADLLPDEDNCPPASSELVPEGDADLLPDEDNCPPASSNLVPEGDADDLPADVEQGASDYCIASEDVDGNQAIVSELTANCRRKTMIHKKRLSTLGITTADDEQIMSQEMFVSIAGNQFKRNGKGSFGTFLF